MRPPTTPLDQYYDTLGHASNIKQLYIYIYTWSSFMICIISSRSSNVSECIGACLVLKDTTIALFGIVEGCDLSTNGHGLANCIQTHTRATSTVPLFSHLVALSCHLLWLSITIFWRDCNCFSSAPRFQSPSPETSTEVLGAPCGHARARGSDGLRPWAWWIGLTLVTSSLLAWSGHKLIPLGFRTTLSFCWIGCFAVESKASPWSIQLQEPFVG